MSAAVEVSGLSKRFRVYHERNQSLKVALMRGRRARFEEFWALRDVDLDIPSGSTYGLVGHNGSGKSTLLKCIAQILQPDAGAVRVNGTMSALLELGAGFHPELSGRDNVYLNGSILGLSRKDIERRFDDIVGFAGLEEFIDTPVKNYSSGMYVRLGFSVAINVEPEILLVDEVLAVGDESFQRKCMEKFREFREQGRTVVLVSHALGSLRTMCDTVALLDHGRLQAVGSPGDVLDEYVGGVQDDAAAESAAGGDPASARWGSGEVRITRSELLQAGRPVSTVRTGEPVTLRMSWSSSAPVDEVVFGLAVYTAAGQHVTGPNTLDVGRVVDCTAGSGWVDVEVPRLLLVPGQYDVALAAYDRSLAHAYDHQQRALRLDVRPGDPADRHGVVSLDPRWTVSGGTEEP